MKLIKFLFSALLVIGLTSCLGETSNKVTQDFSSFCITYMVDNNTGETVTNNTATYKLTSNVDKGTMTVEIGSLKLPNNTTVFVKIEDQKYSINQKGAIAMNVPSFTSNMAGVPHQVTDFKMELYNRYLGQQAFPLLTMSFTLDNNYTVEVIYNPSFYWGVTRVTDQDGKVYTNDAQTSYYGINFDVEKKTATIGAFGAKFAENMPALNMTFSGVPYTLNLLGYTASSSDAITPEISSTPYPAYKITDLMMTGDWGKPQVLQFTCTIDTETVKGVYKVVASLDVLPANTSGGN